LIEVFTPRELLHEVLDALKEAGIHTEEARLEWVPKNSLDLDADVAMKVMGLIEDLEELEDTQMVFSNLNITDDLMMSFEAGS
jgi:transcriptional/translational regulatory protein YebC/TACO1